MKDIAIVFDCGATNVRVIAIDTAGSIIASCAEANETDEDPYLEGGRIWDLDKLWDKLCNASRNVMASVDASRVAGVTFTTFGVDGSFVDEAGKLLYPVISWQCPRTAPLLESIVEYIPNEQLSAISGIHPYAYNTIYKMLWFRKNRPDIIAKAHRFLFIPSLLILKLTGRMVNDMTMSGTSMMTDLLQRNFSTPILKALGIDRALFGTVGEPGDRVGEVSAVGSAATGIPQSTPVFLGGHDTQFALFGSGAELNQPVLSSGTFEILMSRSAVASLSEEDRLRKALTIELDVKPGVCNMGQNWLGSGVLEWFFRNFYPDLHGDLLYETSISEAEAVMPGEHGLIINPDFFNDGQLGHGGSITGLHLHTSRGAIFRALLESMAFRLREALEALQRVGGFRADKIICVGGGSKNRLWNQLRADVCGLPIQTIAHKETTVLGASFFVFAGAGNCVDATEARQRIDYKAHLTLPSANSGTIYDPLYAAFLKNKETH
ncbi:MAG: L-fuculokinase [Bacteroidales bacterium]